MLNHRNEPKNYRINDLPLEVIIKIFSYLPFYDRKSAGLVCTRFYNATLSPKYIEENLLRFRCVRFSIDVEPFSLFVKPSLMRYETICFDVVEFGEDDEKHFQFWKFMGPNIKILKIFRCQSLSSRNLIKMIAEMPNLEQLSFENWLAHSPDALFDLPANGEIPIGFRRLKTISFENAEYMNPEAYNQLIELCPNLREFCHFRFNYELKEIPDCSRLFHHFGRQLTSLKISSDVVPSVFCWRNSKIWRNLRLRLLELEIDTMLEDGILLEFFSAQESLRELVIGCYHAAEKDISFLSPILQQLTCLKLQSEMVIPLHLAEMMKYLETFHFITDIGLGFYHKFTTTPNLVLKELFTVAHPGSLMNIARNFRNMMVLDLHLCYYPHQGEFELFCRELTNLRDLRLVAGQIFMTERLPLYDVSNFKLLKRLVIDVLGDLPGFEFENIAKLKNLNELTIALYEKPSDEAIRLFIENSTSITFINFDGSNGIDDAVVEKMSKNLKRLRIFSTNACPNVLRNHYT